MRLVSLARSLLARHHRATRILVVACVVLAGLVVQSGLRAARSEQRRWGGTTTVLVADRALRAGETIERTTVRSEQWPLALVPSGAVDEWRQGMQALQRVGVGELLTQSDVGAREGVVGLLPPGHRGVVVPAPADLLAAVSIGDVVGVIVAGRPEAEGPVVGIGSESLIVAVPAASAPAVADATLLATASLVVGSTDP